jgi:hypothetical protein
MLERPYVAFDLFYPLMAEIVEPRLKETLMAQHAYPVLPELERVSLPCTVLRIWHESLRLVASYLRHFQRHCLLDCPRVWIETSQLCCNSCCWRKAARRRLFAD